MPPLKAIAAALCLAASLAQPVQAQVGAVEGRIRDDEGSAVFRASVDLIADSVVVRVAESDRLGFFRIEGIPYGAYKLRARGLGYEGLEQDIVLAAAEPVEVELLLVRRAIELEGVSVEADRSRERIRFEEVGGATVRELDLVDLKAVPGIAEADPIRAVAVLPGVVSTSDFSAAFHVRGGSQDQNLILLDGVPVFSPFHLGGFFSVFNADMIDRTALQSGGFGAEHGGRVSSVLEIESDAGDGDLQVDAGISLLATRVAMGGRLPSSVAGALGQANVHWRVSGRRSYFDVLMKPLFDFPYSLTDLQGVLEGWTRGGDRLRLTGYTGNDVLDLTSLDASDFPLRILWEWGNDAAGVRWTRPRRGGGALDVRAHYSGFASGLAFPDFGDTDFRTAVDQLQLRVDLATRPRPGMNMKVGASAESLGYDNYFATGGTEFARGLGEGRLLGAYGQTTWSRARSWLVEAGLRLDSWSPDAGTAVHSLSPRLALKRFFAGGDGAVKLAAGRYTQFVQSLRDEELPIGLDIWVLAGETAPHVVSDQLQVGIEGYPRPDLFLALEGFVRTFDGVITVNPAEDPNDEFDDILPGEGLSYGADLMIRRENGAVNGWLSLSLLKAERTFPDLLSPAQPRRQITYAPIFDRRLDVDLVLRYPLPMGWEGGLRWNVGTGVPYTRSRGSYAYYSPRFVDGGGRLEWAGADEGDDAFGGYAVVLEDRNGSRYPTYHRLDISVRRTLQKSWGTMTPYVDFLNVYNRKNVLFYFYQYEKTPPVRSGISMFPLVPTFGIEVHF
jgi:hypothetical protein